VNVAGLITAMEKKATKSGKPFAKAMLEDFSGTYEIAFFGKDYEKFLPYLQEHAAIFIEGEVKEGYYSKQDDASKPKDVPYKLRINRMSLLGNLAETMLSDISIEVNTMMLNADFRRRLHVAVKQSPGKIPLSVFMIDPKTKYGIEFLSKKYQVAVTSDFLAELKGLGVKYRVTRKNSA